MSCNCGKTSAGRLLGGAVKLAQAELGISRLRDEDIVQARRRACEGCDQWLQGPLRHGRCKACGCFTWHKTRLTRETCPLDRWPSLLNP